MNASYQKDLNSLNQTRRRWPYWLTPSIADVSHAMDYQTPFAVRAECDVDFEEECIALKLRGMHTLKVVQSKAAQSGRQKIIRGSLFTQHLLQVKCERDIHR